MRKLVARIIVFILVISFISADIVPVLTVSAAPAESVEYEEDITTTEEDPSSEEDDTSEEESEPGEENEDESISEEADSEEGTEEGSEEIGSEESTEEVSEEGISEESISEEITTEDFSEETVEDVVEEEVFTGPLVIVQSVEELDEGLAQGINVGVAIDENNFPDEGFRNYVKSSCDKYPYDDNILDAREISLKSSISVSNDTTIKDLTGIEYFRYLNDLECERIGLTKLDISRNNKLMFLNCNYNDITTLDTRYNIRLYTLDCAGNEFTSLDLSKNENLVVLNCSGNELTELNLSKNVLLSNVACFDNKLTSLDLTKNLKLNFLYCDGNKLKKLNLSKNKELLELFCDNNQLKTLNLKNNTKLYLLYCNGNELESLDVTKNKDLKILWGNRNKIKKINLKNNKELYDLQLCSNDLESLDVSSNIQLKQLWVDRNKLKCLDVSKNTLLEELNVAYNMLEELDVSRNKNLKDLGAYYNRLTSINLQDEAILSLASYWDATFSNYYLELDGEESFDVRDLPGDFEVERLDVHSLTGATLNGTVMTVTQDGLDSNCISYNYRYNRDQYVRLYIKVSTNRVAVSIPVANIYYTGKKVEPEIEVKYNGTILSENIDYTVSYVDNINVYESKEGGNKPKFIVKGKGNYSFEKVQSLYIDPIDLSGDRKTQKLEISDIELEYTGKAQYGKPIVYSSGNPIPETELEYIYMSEGEGAYINPGSYEIKIIAKEPNVLGECIVMQHILPQEDAKKSIAKAKIKTDQKSYPYNCETGVTIPGTVTVTVGKTVLTEGTDYVLTYKNHKAVGTATVVVTGIGTYEGTVKKTYKITGKKLTSSMVKILEKKLQYHNSVYLELTANTHYTIKAGDTVLEEGIDYVCVYPKTGAKVGSYKVTFKGIGEYTGSVSKTFKIVKTSIENKTVKLSTITYTYNSAGVKPVPEVYGMTEGTDYTVVYVNNKKIGSATDEKAPCLYIKGIGGYTGTTKVKPVKFTIEKAPLSDFATLSAENVFYKDKNKNYITKFTLIENSTGKKLAKGKDYEKVKYEYKLQDEYIEITTGKCPAEATSLRITVYASEKGGFSGSISTEYQFYTNQISKAKVQEIAAQEYSGQQIRPLPVVTMTVKVDGKTETVTLVKGRDYVLEYGDNRKVGTGTVTIKGIGDYGGKKTVKFKINKRKL